MDHADAVAISAGISGLSVARALAMTGLDLLITEREAARGSGVPACNSEVVHAGLRCPAGSLKRRLCMLGGGSLCGYCEARRLAHQCCGKLLVATTVAERPPTRPRRPAAPRPGLWRA